MSGTRSIIGTQVHDTRTGEIIELQDGREPKFFAAVLKYGHCGRAYYIPLLRGASAVDLNAAITYLNTLGKVKRQLSHWLIDICEITQPEQLLIERIVKKDRFLNPNTSEDVIAKEIEKRRIPLQEGVDFKFRQSAEARYANKIRSYDIREADDFPMDCVVEKYCAPAWVGDKLIYPARLNMRSLIDDYFYHNVKYWGIMRKQPGIATLYYQIYGDDNRLGLKYNDGRLSYTSLKGEDVELYLTDEERVYMDQVKRESLQKLTTEEDYIGDGRRKNSKMDRFKARLTKTAQIHKLQEDEDSGESCL